MKKFTTLLIVTLTVALMVSCQSASTTDTPDTGDQAAAQKVCTKCGEMAGSEQCCKDAEKCGHCGLHKGSPGCCKDMSAGNTVCKKCGELAGSGQCCKDAEKCDMCGKHKGSPGCCK